MSQIQQAEKLLAKLNSEIETAEGRLGIAENQANNLEKRNKVVLDAIEKAGDNKQRLIIEQAKSYLDSINGEIAQAETVKTKLLSEINRLVKKKTSLDKSIDESIEAKENLDKDIEGTGIRYQEMLNQLLITASEIKTNEEKINTHRNQIRELSSTKHQIESDIDLLRNESDIIQTEIIDLGDAYETQKKILEDDLYEIRIKLEKASESLKIAEKTDKQYREVWAEENLKLEKRTEAVRRIEARVSDAESRIEELKRFDIL